MGVKEIKNKTLTVQRGLAYCCRQKQRKQKLSHRRREQTYSYQGGKGWWWDKLGYWD